jgi:hypothetical protein
MSNYTYTTNYLGKDSLPSGDTGKIIKGADFDVDFTAIQAAISSKVDIAGDTITGDLLFNDNVKAKFGTGSDLNIYHDGANSYITDTGTGGVFLHANQFLNLRSGVGVGSGTYILCTTDGSVDLYYNNGKKLETTNTGVTVTGELVATTINGGTF